MKLFKNALGVWGVEIKSESGQTHKVLLETFDEAEALKMVERAHVEKLEQAGQISRLTSEVVSLIVANRKITCMEAVNEWDQWLAKTARSNRTHTNNIGVIRKWMADMACANKAVSEITDEAINQYVNPLESDLKRGTRALRLSAIRGLMQFCLHRRYILSDQSQLVRLNHRVMSHTQRETKHKPVFTDDEVLFLLAKADGAEPPSVTPGFIKAAIILGRDLAIRLGDICNLEWDCFDFVKMTASIWTAKAGSRVEIPLTNRVVSLISSMPVHDKKFLFPRERAIINDVNKRALLSVVFSRFLDSVGMRGYSFHSLRASYATTMANQGATMEEIAEKLGHKNSTVTKVYIRKPGAAKVSLR